MRITIAAVGRHRSDPLAAVIEDYRRRLAWPLTLADVVPRPGLPLSARLEDEAAKLLAHRSRDGVLAALDERGHDLDSAGLATRLSSWREEGRADLTFVIGGADGLAPAVRERADLVLAFGRQTWPHRLVKLMLVEQLYRAWTITTGHPYHRE